MTPSTCSVCGRPCAVGMHHAIKIGDRWVTWRECVTCFVAEEARAEELKREAEADRKVKLPEPPARQKRPTGLPFIDQIEVGE